MGNNHDIELLCIGILVCISAYALPQLLARLLIGVVRLVRMLKR